jgi:hypothetical protein
MPEISFFLFLRASQSEEFIDELYFYLGRAYQQTDPAKACDAYRMGAEKGEKRCLELAENCS